MSQSYNIERVTSAKRFLSTFLGKDFTDTAERSLIHSLGEDFADITDFFGPEIRNNTKRQKKSSSTSTMHLQSRLSPLITKSHTISFYNDPRDKVRSDLDDSEDWTTAMDCCDRCQLMTGTVEGLRALVSNEGYEHYTCNETKQQSAASGCPLCELIWRIIARCEICSKSKISSDGAIRVRGSITGDIAVDENPLRSGARLEALRFEIPIDHDLSPNVESHHHEMDLIAFQESPVAQYVVGRRPDKNLTPELSQRIRRWLNDCQDKHESCPRRCFPVLPFRIIDIGDREDAPIRLHISHNGARGQYAALSYCWGVGSQPYKTTLSNLNSYIQELALNIFPKTLLDAIKVCREVGMRYIWIDALCIVQDDPKERTEQINQMGRIYKDATFAIVAASAKSVDEGFLGNAKVDAPEAKLPFYIDEDSFGAVFVKGHHNYRPYFLDKEPIFNRAWTLQEMLLPSRILMFDSYQVTLKCGKNDFLPAMDTYLNPELPINSKSSPEYGILQNFHIERLAKEYEGDSSLTEDIYAFTARGYSRQSQIWTSLMAEYSRRDISVIDDRYPALAGVTEELQKIWAGEYVAGFWKGSLVQHLGWVGGVNSEEFGGRKWKSRLEGPSWSWMSHPSSISIDPVAITDVTVLGCVTELASTDQPFGKVKKGILVLEARTLPLSYLGAKIRPNINASWKRASAIMPSAIDGTALDFPQQGMPGGELKALLLGLTFSSVEEHCLSFLVLQKLKRGTYERIGHAVMHTTEGDRSEQIGHAVVHTADALQSTKEILGKAKREVIIIE